MAVIPKIIYTTWISDQPMPAKFKTYFDSWRRVMPDYDIRVLTLENITRTDWVQRAIDARKFVLASNYARCAAIHETGGIYFDVDVEAVQSLDQLLSEPMFVGCEDDEWLGCAVFGAQKGHPFLSECMAKMQTFDIDAPMVANDTGPRLFTRLLKSRGWKPANRSVAVGDIQVHDTHAFYPYSYREKFTPACVTKGTFTIHRWAHTWIDAPPQQVKGRIAVCIPTRGVVFTEVMRGVVSNTTGKDWTLLTTTDQGLPDCMNQLVEAALASGAEWLWVVEEDTAPPAGVLDRLLAEDADYIACDYPVGDSHTCFGFDAKGILWTGLGCTLIRADVLRKMPRPWFECNANMTIVHRHELDVFTHDPSTVVNKRGGHDLSFCAKLRKMGVEIRGLEHAECRHLKLDRWNTDGSNSACHTIHAVPAVRDKWPAYLEKPTVAIIIPCYNYAEFLAEAIESALAQTVPCEVIVVDDGSTDGSAKVAARYPVKLVRQKNKGLPAARNAGIVKATGTHVLPLDADDTLHPDCVEKMLTANVGMIVRGLWNWNGRAQRLPPDVSLGAWMDSNRTACTTLFPRAAWAKVGGFDEAMRDGYEDWDFWVRLVAAGYGVATIDEQLFDYRYHGDSMVKNSHSKRDEIKAYMHAKWERLGIVPLVSPTQPARHELHYPICIAVPVTGRRRDLQQGLAYRPGNSTCRQGGRSTHGPEDRVIRAAYAETSVRPARVPTVRASWPPLLQGARGPRVRQAAWHGSTARVRLGMAAAR